MRTNRGELQGRMSMAPDEKIAPQGVDNKCSHGNTFHGLEIRQQVVEPHERHDF